MTTDPEASIVRRGSGKTKLSYQAHRAVDGAYEVVTQTIVGPGDENEANRLMELIAGRAIFDPSAPGQQQEDERSNGTPNRRFWTGPAILPGAVQGDVTS